MRRPLIAVMVLLATASLAAQWRFDTIPPTVSLTAPAQGAVVAVSVALSATAQDNVRVSGVQFLVDGVTLGLEDTLAPYTRTWNTTTVANGPHTISARARDGSGNRTTATITVTVNNGTTPPPPCTLAATATAPGSAAAGASVSFTALATASNCTGTIAYVWAFGDGVTASARTATHSYAAVGAYGWTMTASVAGVSITKTGTITIVVAPPPPPCTLSVTATVPASGTVNTSVAFSATAKPANCTGAVAYVWAFGDGAGATTQAATHTYTVVSTDAWSVTATVAGVSATAAGTIDVLAAPVENVLFYDDFSSGVDTTKWDVLNQQGDPSNSEKQWYLPGNVTTTADGMLQLLTQVQSYNGYAYTSGAVVWKTFAYTYGTLEYRAKMAGGTGTWPAIWLLGKDCRDATCNWPAPGSDEIDITEIMNGQLTSVNQQIHSAGNNNGCRPSTSNVAATFHTYKLVWTQGALDWYIDGVVTCSQRSGIPSTPMVLIIDTAVGGIGGGTVNNATLPQTMLVDYVKVTK